MSRSKEKKEKKTNVLWSITITIILSSFSCSYPFSCFGSFESYLEKTNTTTTQRLMLNGPFRIHRPLYGVVKKNLNGHRPRNGKTAIMFITSLAFVIFAGSMFELQGRSLTDNIKVLAGAGGFGSASHEIEIEDSKKLSASLPPHPFIRPSVAFSPLLRTGGPKMQMKTRIQFHSFLVLPFHFCVWAAYSELFIFAPSLSESLREGAMRDYLRQHMDVSSFTFFSCVWIVFPPVSLFPLCQCSLHLSLSLSISILPFLSLPFLLLLSPLVISLLTPFSLSLG